MSNINSGQFDAHRLIDALERQPDTSLVFSTDGNEIKRGYHVTEIKRAQVASLDCQRGSDEWQEVTIQLLDGMALPTQKHMPVEKFLGIVKPSLADQGEHRLYFEFAPGNGAFHKLSIDGIETGDTQTTIRLSALTPECKPMTKALSACCASQCC